MPLRRLLIKSTSPPRGITTPGSARASSWSSNARSSNARSASTSRGGIIRSSRMWDRSLESYEIAAGLLRRVVFLVILFAGGRVQCTAYLSTEATYSKFTRSTSFSHSFICNIYYIMRRRHCVSQVAHLISIGGNIRIVLKYSQHWMYSCFSSSQELSFSSRETFEKFNYTSFFSVTSQSRCGAPFRASRSPGSAVRS